MLKHRIVVTNLLTMIAFTMLIPLVSVGAAGASDDLLQILRARDAQLREPFLISATVETPVHVMLTDQGTVVRQGRVSQSPSARGLILNQPAYSMPARFKPLGAEGYKSLDYDKAGNLILWKPSETYALQAPGLNIRYEELALDLVQPNGQILSEEMYLQVKYYNPSDNQSLYDFDRLLLAAGRGFSRELSLITESVTTKEGLIQARALGTYGSGLSGTWELMIDPGADYLVRRATFTAQGQSRPSLLCSASGRVARDDGRLIAAFGTVTHPLGVNREHRTVVAFHSFQKDSDYEMLSALRAHVTRELPAGTEIIDYQDDPYRPVRRTIGEK